MSVILNPPDRMKIASPPMSERERNLIEAHFAVSVKFQKLYFELERSERSVKALKSAVFVFTFLWVATSAALVAVTAWK